MKRTHLIAAGLLGALSLTTTMAAADDDDFDHDRRGRHDTRWDRDDRFEDEDDRRWRGDRGNEAWRMRLAAQADRLAAEAILTTQLAAQVGMRRGVMRDGYELARR